MTPESKPTILIVDDEPFGREALEGVLFAENYTLITAQNGAEALEKAGEHMPDVILLDVMMPGMDGFEVCRRIRADAILAEIPILLVTALEDRDSRLRGIEAGADDFITKPFDRVELRARVRTIVRLNRYRKSLLERARFVWVIEHSPDGYLILDREGRIKFANPKARLYLNLPQEESQPVRADFHELAARLYNFVTAETCRQALTANDGEAHSCFLVRPETETSPALWLEMETIVLPWDAQSDRLVHLAEVSREMQLQQEMGAFHVAIRHKFVTPVANIILALQLLLQQHNRMTAEDLEGTINGALENADRLKKQVEAVMKYLSAASLVDSSATFPLQSLQDLVTLTGGELGLEGWRFDLAAELATASLPLSWQIMEIILWEVLDNAVKHHPELTPKVAIAVSRTADGKAALRITDDGRTLSPQELSRALVPYFQAEKVFTGEVRGMGLGLSLVASLAWRVGGDCRIYNNPAGSGVVVELILPLL